uniref:Nucleolar 27S pre-rRNA processing Urb2/Npa2 C-terminal domain-containing protein n=1 Tax=Clastoptera arizonana TaxID=38151 RepID=A0A1B6EEC9_9HEMI
MSILSEKILSKLNDTNIEFSTRCNIAYGAFISPMLEYGLVNKEEIIFDWLASNSNKTDDEFFTVLRMLLRCLGNEYLTSLKKIVSPNSCLKFLKKTKKYPDNEEIQKNARDCTRLLISTVCFQMHYKNNIGSLVKAICLHYNTVSIIGHSDDDKCGNCIELILKFYNETFFKEDLAINFLDVIMPVIFSMPQSICNCYTSSEMHKLITQMFFKDSRFITELSSLKKSLNDPTFLQEACSKTQTLVNTFKESVKCQSEEAMARFYSIFLSLVKKHTKLCSFKFFICMSSTLGFKYEQGGLLFEDNNNPQKSLKVLLAMINELQISKITLDLDEASKELFNWMTSLLKLVMSPAFGITMYVLAIIQSVLNLIPTIITNVIPNFIEYIMIPYKESNIQDLYVLTLNSVMDIYQKLTRLSKLFDVMIETILTQIRINPILLSPCSVMLPIGFILNLEQLITNMSDSQVSKTLMCLSSHLSKEVAEYLDTSTESIEIGRLTVFEFIATLLECILRNVKLDNSVEGLRHYHVFANIALSLKTIGKYILKTTFNIQLTQVFLKLCRAWGDCILVIKHYDNSEHFDNALMYCKSLSFQSNLEEAKLDNWCDITYTFKFLSSEEWTYIGHRVYQFMPGINSNDFCNMILLNLELLKLADTLSENKIKETLLKILSIASQKWLWNNLSDYSKYIDENTAVDVVTTLTESQHTSSLSKFEIINALKNMDEKEGRVLSVLFGLSWLHEIAQILNNFGMKRSQKMLSIIKNKESVASSEMVYGSYFDVLNDENDSFTDDGVYKMDVKFYCDTMEAQMIKNLNKSKNSQNVDENCSTQIQRLLELLYHLKVTDVSPTSCKLLLFGYLAILDDLTQQQIIPLQLLLSTIYEILSKNIYLIESLWLQKNFFLWFYKVFDSQPFKRNIFSLVCDFLVKKPISSEFTKSLVSNLDVAPLIIASYLKSQQTLKRKRDNFGDEIQILRNNFRHFMRAVHKAIKSSLNTNGVQRELLHVFSLYLKHSIHTKSTKRIEWCSNYLDGFNHIVMNNLLQTSSTNLTTELLYIETLFSNWTLLRDKTEKGIHVKLWSCLNSKSDLCINCMQLLLEALNVQEYEEVLESMKTETIKNNVLDTNLESLDKAWKIVMCTKVNAEKIRKKLIYKDFLENEFSSLAMKWVTTPPTIKCVKAVFNIISAIVKTQNIRLDPVNLDVIFILMSLLPPTDFEALTTGLNLLGNILTKRSAVALMHLPSFLQRYRFFLTCLAKSNFENIDEERKNSLSKCTNVIEKLAMAMSTHRAELSIHAPNLIADIIQLLVAQKVHPIVKRSLLNTVNAYIPLCSQKNIEFLLQGLSQASREIFKNIYQNYNKFHRYHGKV